MKRFATILCIALAALVLFVSCDDKVKTEVRPATEDEIDILICVFEGCWRNADVEKADPPALEVSKSGDKITVVFKNYSYESKLENDIVLNGRYEQTETGDVMTGSFVCDKNGVSIDGEKHNISFSFKFDFDKGTVSDCKAIYDNYELTGIEVVFEGE